MGHKKVCFQCRKAFSVYLNEAETINLTCPECGEQGFLINHKFRPPKQTDTKQWELAEFLKDHGFFFNHAYELIGPGIYKMAAYPKNMEEAREFVLNYGEIRMFRNKRARNSKP